MTPRRFNLGREKMRDDIASLFFYLIVFALLMFAAWFFRAWSCQSRAEQMGIPFRYGIVTGCMIKPKDQDWVPIENYRVM